MLRCCRMPTGLNPRRVLDGGRADRFRNSYWVRQSMSGKFRIDDSVRQLFTELAKSDRRARQASILRKSRLVVKALDEMDFDEHTQLASTGNRTRLHVIRGLDEEEPHLEVGVVVNDAGAYAFHAARFHNVSERSDIRARMIMLAPSLLPSAIQEGRDG